MTLQYPEPPLTDAVVLLRPWQGSDLPVLERASADEYVAEIERLPTPFTETGGREWINRKLSLRDAGRGWAFAIVELASSEVVGGIGIRFRHPPDAAEPGWWMIAGKRNEGLAERAGRLLCRWALTDDTGIARIQATVEPRNLASQRLLEKLGFVREGLLRSYSAWRGGRQDVFLYSLLTDDLIGKEEGEAPGI